MLPEITALVVIKTARVLIKQVTELCVMYGIGIYIQIRACVEHHCVAGYRKSVA
jgi:hypothetical protein